MNENLARSEFGMHLREMRQKAWLILGCAVIAALAVGGVRAVSAGQSTATAVLQVTLGAEANDDGDVTEFRARQLAELARTTTVLELVATTVDDPITTSELRSQLDVELGDTPGFLSITAEADSPEAAVALANGMALALTETSSATTGENTTERVTVVEPARLEDVESSGGLQRSLRDGFLAFVVAAIVIGEGVVLLRIARGRFSPTDAALEASDLADAPVLDLRSSGRNGEVGFFHQYLDGRPLITVLDLHPGADRDPAETLASAAADLHGRVLLVDGGGRAARIHTSLALDLEPGLADLVRHGLELRAVVRPGGPHLRCGVITAGVHQPSDPSTAVILASARNQLRATGADAVVVSVPVAGSFDDAAAAVHSMPDCVVIAFDPDRQRVRNARQRIEQLRSLGASISGVVLTSTADESDRT